MYASHQSTLLAGEGRLAAYQAALSILAQNATRFPYDARTALYLAHVISLAPPGAAVDQDMLASAIATSIKESPKRSQPRYVLVNLSIGEANAYPVGSNERAKGYGEARDTLERYIALVPTLSEPHFVLADLDWATGDVKAAEAEAALGKQYYQSEPATAR